MTGDDRMNQDCKSECERKQIDQMTGDDRMTKIVKVNVKTKQMENTWKQTN